MALGLVDLRCYSNLLGTGPHASHQLTGNGHRDSNSRCPIIHRKQAVLSIVVFAIGRKMRRTDSTSYDSGLHRQ